MHDCRALARRLRDVLVISTLVSCSSKSGSSGGGESTTPEVLSNSDDGTADPGPRIGADGLPIADPPFPQGGGNCDGGAWCGHPEVGLARARAGGGDASEQLGCAVGFSDSQSGLYFYFDQDTTSRVRQTSAEETCCYTWSSFCGEGRPLVEHAADGSGAVALLAAVLAGPARGLVTELERIVGEAWLASARAEHASVASFARAALELMAVGAPLDLVTAASRAGLDEVAHTRGCLALARRYLRCDLDFGPLPAAAPRPADLVTLAITTFHEGCVGETVSTVMAQRARAGCQDPPTRRLLDRIARDEARHAELAWRTVAWAVSVGGAPVAAALRDAARLAAGDARPVATEDARLASFGRLDGAAQAAAIADAWREIVAPTLALMIT